MELREKRVVVTGASTGIGYVLVKDLLLAGCKVLGVARDMSKNDIEHENFHKFNMDVSTIEGNDKVFAYALEKLGGIDIFVANAGRAFYEKMGKADWSHYEDVYKLNVYSAIYSAQKMKDMHGDEPFNVVITSSAMAFISIPGYSLYASTKAALRGFADAYRYELNKNQKLQLVFPIATKTNFFHTAKHEIPMCWPVQTAEVVSKKVMRALRTGKNNIHPSKLFLSFNIFATICPLLERIYNIRNDKGFKEWSSKSED